MLRLFAILLFTALHGCVHQITLPLAAGPACSFAVTDDRPDAQHLYAMERHVIQIRTEPTVAESLKGAVCVSSESTAVSRSSFVITDFDCTVSGSFVLTYIVELRGILTKSTGDTMELRAGNKIDAGLDTGAGYYIPKGCQMAAAPVIPALAAKIVGAVGG